MHGAIRQVEFRGGAGATLAGALHLPAADVRGGILLAHCFTCGKDLSTTTRLARGLSDAGYAVLRFDFTGLGDSQGEFSATTLATSVADLRCALGVLEEHGHTPLGMAGHSYGGAATLLAAAAAGAAAAGSVTAGSVTAGSVAVLGAPSDPRHLERLLQERDGRHIITVNQRVFALDPGFVAELQRADLRAALSTLGCPLLVLHAADDEVVPLAHGEALFAAASEPKRFHLLASGGHLLDRASAAACVAALVDWFDETLR